MIKFLLIAFLFSIGCFAQTPQIVLGRVSQLQWEGAGLNKVAIWENPIAFSPQDIAGCYVWLDASDVESVAAYNGSVSGWTDKISTSVASPVNVAPTYVSDALNGKGVIRFNATSVYHSEGLAMPKLFDGQAYTVFMVSLMRNAGDDGNPYDRIVCVDNPELGYLEYAMNETMAFGLFTSENFGVQPPAWMVFRANAPCAVESIAWDTYYIGTMTKNGGTIGAWLNGQPTSINAGTDNSPLNATRLLIGCSAAQVDSELCGDIAEIIIYTGELSTADRIKVESYLSEKWAIQINGNQ